MFKNKEQIKNFFQENHKYEINQYNKQQLEIKDIESYYNFFSNNWFLIVGIILLCIFIIYLINNKGGDDNNNNISEYEFIDLRDIISDKLNYLIENNELPLDKLPELEIKLQNFLVDIENKIYSETSINFVLDVLDDIFKSI